MNQRGYFTVGHWRRIPIRIHWSAPLGALLWTGGSPSLVRITAFLFMILLHELGHAALVRRARAWVTEITSHGMGGECWWQGRVSPLERALIAFGGVFAQLGLAGVTFAWAFLFPPKTPFAFDLVEMFTVYNLFNAAFNLVPVPPLDGSQAWALFPLLWKRWRAGAPARRRRRRRNELRVIDGELRGILAEAARRTRKLDDDRVQ